MPDRDNALKEEFPMREWVIPQIGVSPVTGVQGTLFWGGINRPDQRSRWVIGDADLDDCINYIPQAVQLQQVPYRGANIATLAASLIWMSSQFIRGIPYLFCLCSNGHIYQVSLSGVITDINSSGGFSTSPVCDIANWQGTTVLINDPAAQKIYAWNGTTFTTALSTQPNTHIQVYQNRLWIFYGLTITWTDTNTYNSLGGVAGSFVITDNDADSQVQRGIVFAGSLYLVGSDWIKTISGLQSIGSPAVLLFQVTGLLSQVGVTVNNPTPVISYGNSLFFANTLGIWELNGTTPEKISNQVDGFWQNLDLTQSSFSAGYAHIYDIPCLFWQVYYKGDANVSAGACVIGVTVGGESPGQWFRIQQPTITYITGVEAFSPFTNTNYPSIWASDGTNIFQLFVDGVTQYQAQVNTKIWDVNGSKIDKKTWERLLIASIFSAPSSITPTSIGASGLAEGAFSPTTTNTLNPGAMIWINSFGSVITWLNNTSGVITWVPPIVWAYYPFQFRAGWTSRALGLNIVTNGAGVILQSLILGYRETRGNWGPP